MSLINEGTLAIGTAEESSKRTIVVIGVARGGTSMCAGTLAKLGVFMGRNSPPPTYEDLDIYRAIEKNHWNEIKSIIETYNKEHDTWALKLPILNDKLEKLHTSLRNPTYIFIFRDLAAIANRASLSHRYNYTTSLLEAQSNYERILKFISTSKPNGIICSYEKAIAYKSSFVSNIISLLPNKTSITSSQREAALNNIQRNPQEYLESTSFRGDLGYLDLATKSKISGWATTEGSTLATLDLVVNGSFIKQFVSNSFREDLLNKKIHKTGHCSFILTPPIELQTGDKVSIRFTHNQRELRGSPVTIA